MSQIDDVMSILYGDQPFPETIDELFDLNVRCRIVERKTLPQHIAENFFSDWLVVLPSGQVTGCTSEATARDVVEKYERDVSYRNDLFPHDSPVWSWFSLTYCAYAVMPRAVLCAMPAEWQARFVSLMSELENRLDIPDQGNYTVQLRDDKGRFTTDPFADYKYFDRSLIKDRRK